MKYIVILFLILFSIHTNSQSILGKWKGDIQLPASNLPLIIEFGKQNDVFNAIIESPAQPGSKMRCDSVTIINDAVFLTIKNMNVTYTGTWYKDSIAGIFTQNGQRFVLNLKPFKQGEVILNRPQMPKPPFSYNIEDVSFINTMQGNKLAATFTTPKGKLSFPVVIIITGSGPQDRDGSIFGHKLYWVLADHLSKNGIGVLRLDDRGIGGSEAGKLGATTADFVTDINSAVQYLSQRGFKNIGLIGHSEGGMIAPLVANLNKNVAFIISMAGPGVLIETLMKRQLAESLRLAKVPEDIASINIAVVNEAYQFNNIYTGNSLATDLQAHLDEKFPLSAQMNKAVAVQVGLPWFSYFAKQNPQLAIEKLKIPVLAINGSMDSQVDAKQNLAGWKASLQKAGNRNFETVELPNLNHLFQTAKTGAVSEYATIEETIAPIALQIIAQWILKTAN